MSKIREDIKKALAAGKAPKKDKGAKAPVRDSDDEEDDDDVPLGKNPHERRERLAREKHHGMRIPHASN